MPASPEEPRAAPAPPPAGAALGERSAGDAAGGGGRGSGGAGLGAGLTEEQRAVVEAPLGEAGDSTLVVAGPGAPPPLPTPTSY
jgi:hypothetical protein